MSSNATRRQLARATTLYARSIYSELQRAGYGRDDILRFVNEVMELLSGGGNQPATEPPQLLDPESGLPDRDAILEILAFEVRRLGGDRRRGLVVMTVDVVLPSWTTTVIRKAAHEKIASELTPRMRATDSLGRLGPDRYLLILTSASIETSAVVRGRIEGMLETNASALPDAIRFEIRCVDCESRTANANALLERCFAEPPISLPRRIGLTRTKSGRLEVPGSAPKLTLAFGGGAARAASHAGVLAAVEAQGMDVVGIAGCSAGGLVAAMYARGMAPAAITDRFASFVATPTYREMRRAYAAFLLRGRRNRQSAKRRFIRESALALHSDSDLFAVDQALFESFIAYFVGPDCELSSLRFPLAVVATDLVEATPVILSHGSMHTALAASCAVPGLFPPQAIGSRLFIDGSPVSEVPIGAAHALGLNSPVLGVHLLRPIMRMKEFLSSAEVVTRMNSLVHSELVREQLSGAGFLVSVPVGGVGWLDFRQAAELARMGEAAAREVLPRIAEQAGIIIPAEQPA